MAGDTVITVIGNLTADRNCGSHRPARQLPTSRWHPPRTFDRQTNEWKDGEALFLRCNIWREAAENVTESLVKGHPVIVQGRLKQRSYETREGEAHSRRTRGR